MNCLISGFTILSGEALNPKYGWCCSISHLNAGEEKEMPGFITHPESFDGLFETESDINRNTAKESARMMLSFCHCNNESVRKVAVESAGCCAAMLSAKKNGSKRSKRKRFKRKIYAAKISKCFPTLCRILKII